MSWRIASILLTAALVMRASGAVLSIPGTVGAPVGLGPQLGAGFSLAPAPLSVGLAVPSALSLTPALAAAPSIARAGALAAVVAPAAAIAQRPTAPFSRLRMIRGFDSSILGNRRDVAVYLPPGYETSDARYPVLYVQDGQNMFDPATAFGGADWQLGQTLDRLIMSGEMAPVIVIAAYNTSKRMSEYTPVVDEDHGGGNGDAYGRFLSDELKPFVDAHLRTRPEAENTAIMGSSLGGLISLHLAFTRPDVFARAAALSPSLWWSGWHMTRWTHGADLPEPRPKLWIDMGTEEGGEPSDHALNIAGLREFDTALHERGWREGRDLSVHEIDGAGHNELAWRARAAAVLAFLFPPAPRP